MYLYVEGVRICIYTWRVSEYVSIHDDVCRTFHHPTYLALLVRGDAQLKGVTIYVYIHDNIYRTFCHPTYLPLLGRGSVLLRVSEYIYIHTIMYVGHSSTLHTLRCWFVEMFGEGCRNICMYTIMHVCHCTTLHARGDEWLRVSEYICIYIYIHTHDDAYMTFYHPTHLALLVRGDFWWRVWE